MGTCKSNKQLQVEVREELAREPSIDSDAVGITADRGLIFLSGHALGATRRRKAQEAALRVDGVRAVIDELKVRAGRWVHHDADLACVATDCLDQLIGLPDGRVKVVVRDGKVRLKGVVSSPEEKALISSTVQRAIGHDGTLDNAIGVEPEAYPSSALAFTPTMTPLDGEHVSMLASGGLQFEDSPTEATSIIVLKESFTDEGIPMWSIHHREFPEIRIQGETSLQCIVRLAQHLNLAREHASEDWQRVGIDRAIRDLRAYHSSLTTRSNGERTAGPADAATGAVHEGMVLEAAASAPAE